MGRSQETFNKKEVRSKKEKKKKDKAQRRLEKRESSKETNMDDMIAYVDENGNISSTPPDPDNKQEVDAESIEISIPHREEEEDADTTRKGTVTFFNETKGFGFIRDSETKDSVFVHANNLFQPIKEGNYVSFEVERGPKGLAAKQVKLI